jgi:hypothetical protein
MPYGTWKYLPVEGMIAMPLPPGNSEKMPIESSKRASFSTSFPVMLRAPTTLLDSLIPRDAPMVLIRRRADPGGSGQMR